MKKLIFLLFIITTVLHSQNFEPTPWEFIWGTSSSPRPFVLDSFNQKSILTGFQWGGSTKMNNALENNAATGSNYTVASESVKRPINMLLQPRWVDSTDYSPGYFAAVMMQYDPSLPLNDTNIGNILRPGDKTDPVFGFLNRKGRILSNSLDENYSRLILERDSSYVGTTVLDSIWPQPEFDSEPKDGQTDSYSGKKWYLTVNLRRLNPTTDIIKDDSVIISLKIPYSKWNSTTGYIQFNKIPNNNSVDTVVFDYFEDRGIGLQYSTTTYPIDSIIITRNMLPIADDGYEDITISAEFITNGNSDDYNYKFSNNIKDTVFEAIKDFDIEVNYFGKTDIAIDYIRIENVRAHHLLRGEYDSLGTNPDTSIPYIDRRGFKILYEDPDNPTVETHVNTIKDIIQSAIDNVKIESNDWADANIFRFKFQDTENDSYYWWGTLRYCNKFSNGIFMTRDNLKNSNLYYHYTESPNKWIGVGIGSDAQVPAPYARNGQDNILSFGLKTGFKKHLGSIAIDDTLNSHYETKLQFHSGFPYELTSLENDTFYTFQLYHNDVLQVRYEGGILGSYFDEVKNGFLFKNNPWFFYNLIYNVGVKPIVIGNRDSNAKFGYYRAKTAEEFRLMNLGALIKGCKGFLSDGDQNNKFPNLGVDSPGIGDYNMLNEYNDIYSDSVGTDFINAKYNTWNIWDYVNLDTVAKYQEVDTSRIYIGTKSMRSELFEFNSFVRANDSLLMNLRLTSAMSKGFRNYYTQDHDTFGSDTLMSKFISLDESNTYTTRIVKKSVFDNNLVEPFDSSFFEMTVLREEGVPMDSVFYIGVLNRRTDPLIYYTNPLNPSQKYLRFLSSAEFLDSCENSADTALYRSYWWKRQGARKLTIPFNYTYSDTNDYNLLRISEIGSDVDSLNSLLHRDPKYYDMVTDTVIGQDRSLSFNLLPGQAKILKVQVLKPDIVEGFLDNYNQNNLVEYRDPADSSRIVYHLAFYKNSIRPDDTTKVYKEVQYIRSFPIKRNSQSENIIWDSTSRVNLSKLFFESINPISPKYDDCNHPALVVREDDSGLPHPYVVYTCKDSAVSHTGKGRVIFAKVSPYGTSVEANSEIFRLSFNDIERFGTPTINASANGNYIAWTDSLRGLFVAYQKKEENTITDLDSIRIFDFSNVTPKSILYPSFNTYSHIEKGENNAGLVWYQADLTSGRIFYSRISFDATNDTIVIKIPDNYAGDNHYQKDIFSRMMRVSQHDFVNDYMSKPIIYRSLSNYTTIGVPWCQYNRYDNINWIEPQSTSMFSPTKINGVTLYHRDSSHVNLSWSSSKINEIKFSGLQKDVIVNSINSAQQDGIISDTTEIEVGGNFNLNFTLDSAVIYQIPGLNGSNFLKKKTFGYEANYPMIAPKRASYGNMVQLAKSKKPNFNEGYNMWKNRRVFESDEQDSLGNPIIKTSAHLFYKAAHTETMSNQVFYGFTGNSNNVYFDLPKFEGDPSPISSFPIDVGSHPNRMDPCAFILNDNVGASFIMPGLILNDANSDGEKEMEISIYGHKNSDISVILERAYDSAQVVLTMPPLTPYPSGAVKLVYSILDSTTSEFNLIFQNNDTTAFYNEKAFIGGLANVDTINYKSAIEKNPVKYIIDFNNGGVQYEAKNINDFDLTVYPNPTSGNLRVQAFLPEKLDGYKIENRSLLVTVYDATGRKVLSQNGATGQMFEFDLSNSPTGAYIVTVTHNEGNKIYTATERVVKE